MFCGDTICDSDIAREAEIIAWHKQKLVLFCCFTEAISIRLQRLYKKIKRTIGTCHGIPAGGKRLGEERSVFLIY